MMIKTFIKKNKSLVKRWLRFIYLFKLGKEVREKKKLNVGAGDVKFDGEWFSCDMDILNITKRHQWYRLLGLKKLDNIFAEHVWEHLTDKDTKSANRNCHFFLKKKGRLRLAVPDGFHPDTKYIDYVKPNGTGIGSDDHKILYNYLTMKEKLEFAGFKVELLEYWDEKGQFHYRDWNNEFGKVMRSRRYDSRNKGGELNYTSLIVDAIK